MTEALDFIRSHRFFRNLSRRQQESLLQHCRVLDCQAGSVLFYRNEAIDSLLLVMDGMLALGEERAFSGNALFLSALALSVRCESSLLAGRTSRVIQLRREAFYRWLRKHPRARRKLQPRGFGPKNWGFPRSFWKEYASFLPSRRQGKAQAVLVLRKWWVFWLVKQLPLLAAALLCLYFPTWRLLALLPGVLFLFSWLYRRANGLYIHSSECIARIFRIRGLRRSSIKIPLEQVQSIEVHRKGILQSIFRIGSLSLKTSTGESSLLLKQLFRPEKALDRLNQLRKSRQFCKDPLNSLKKAWNRRKEQGQFPREVFRGEFCSPPDASHGSCRFRKSFYVLFKQLLLPVGIMLLPLGLLFSGWLPEDADKALILVSLIPLPVVWYRWEDWRNDIFKVEGGTVYDVDKKPLGREMTRRNTSLSHIENITARQKGFAGWLFNCGEVRILLPGNTGDFVFEEVADPWQVQDQLMQLRREEEERNREKQGHEREEELLALADLLSQELSR